MARMIPVLLVLLVLAAGLGAALVPIAKCPDCPIEFDCIRCRKSGKITLLESRRREPLDPTLARWLKSRGTTASFAGDLAEKHGRLRTEMLGWRGRFEYYHFSSITLVDGPDGPLALALLLPRTRFKTDDSASRVLLFDRRGRELDRRDVSMARIGFGLDSELEDEVPASVLVRADDPPDEPNATIRVASGSGEILIPRKDWPPGWAQRGVARIVVRNGRLEVVAP